ncbi:MAG: hypothetical protein KN64_15020 [Sulfurovum sp. AS07-7]|nr:MAG: hypothetical protein KN64_15020 [Sulfurovum sp. AS07-7]
MRKVKTSVTVAAFLALLATDASAEFKIKNDNGSWMAFSPRLQVWGESFSDGGLEGGSQNDFFVRRFRLLLAGGILDDTVTFRAQLNDGGIGEDKHQKPEGYKFKDSSYLLEGFLGYKMEQELQMRAGLYVPPSNRTLLDGTFDQLMIDRSGLQSTSMNAGLATRYGFNRMKFKDAAVLNSSGLTRADEVDMGITLWGSHDFDKDLHGKYYFGAHTGIESGKRAANPSASAPLEQLAYTINPNNNMRYSGRVQLNFMDAENGYEQGATYMGKKKTVGIGASYDTQAEVAVADISKASYDYNEYELDIFAELPDSFGSTTLRAEYMNVDLDGLAPEFEGSGYNIEAGYFIKEKLGIGNLQPSIRYVDWKADDAKGDFQSAQVGLNYYLKGNDAKIQLAYERFEPKVAQLSHPKQNFVTLAFQTKF